LLLCAPMLLLYEAILLAAALQKGWLKAYLLAFQNVRRYWPILIEQRQQIQATRQISDRELLSARGLSFVPGLVTKPVARLAQRLLERVLAAYWHMISLLL